MKKLLERPRRSAFRVVAARIEGGVAARPVLVVENALGGAVEVVILAVAQGPEKDDQPGEAQNDRDRNEIEEIVHAVASASIGRGRRRSGCQPRRRALSTTTTEEADMATAARNGLTSPDRRSTRLNSSHVKISYAVF